MVQDTLHRYYIIAQDILHHYYIIAQDTLNIMSSLHHLLLLELGRPVLSSFSSCPAVGE